MTNLELSLLMGIWPIIYFLIYCQMNGNLRITTNILGRKGEVITVGTTHSLIRFDDGAMNWYRHGMYRKDER